MTTSPDINAAKDRLTDSLSNVHEATRTAVTDQIAPAVSAAIDAAREVSGPAYAGLSSRASDATDAMLNSAPVQALHTKSSTHNRRWPLVAGALAISATAIAVMKRRARPQQVADAAPPTQTL